MEKLIYVHVVTLAEKDGEDLVEVYMESKNDWYVIKPKTNGDDGVELCRAFEGVASLNHPNPPLQDTVCQVIGSYIYVFAGTCLVCNCERDRCGCNSSTQIRCTDTQNPRHGWHTCFTIPAPITLGSRSKSVVVDDRWLYVFAANYDRGFDRKHPRFYAFDVVDRKTVKPIPHIGGIPYPPNFITCTSPGTLVAFTGGYENKFYQLDCNESDSDWKLFMEGFPYPSLVGTYAVEDGILYILDEDENKFISYDIGNKKELFVASLPLDFPFGVGVLVVLSKNSSFCYLARLWPSHSLMHLIYTRFSVHYHSPQSEPYVLIEENQTFALEGACDLLNVVVV